MLYLSVDGVTVSESDGFADLVLRLDAPANAAFTVNYTTAQGNASYANNASNDFLYTTGALTFAPGETTRTVSVPITENAVAEGLEHFWFQLGLPTASQSLVTLVRTEVPVFIVDNDASLGGTPIVSVGDVTVDEATSGVARFVFTLDRPATATTSVQYQTVAGSAQAGSDFTATTGTVTFAAGDTVQVVEVPLVDDAQSERAEQFTLQLGAATGLVVGTPQAVATIGANDGAAMPRPVLTVDTVTVGEADGFATMVLRLDAPSNSAITVNYANAQGDASYANNASNDFRYVNGTVVFEPGQTVHTVQVPITEDTTTEDLEHFWFQPSVPAASQNLVTLARSEVPVFIVDNDSIAGGTPVVSVGDVTVDEATSGYVRFVVSLDRAATSITTVQYQSVGGTAQAGQDFTAASGTVTFLPGDTARVVEVPLLDDAQAERAEQFTLQLSSPTGLVLGVPQAVATIGANDAAAMPRPVLHVDDVTVSEADGFATMVLRLDAPSNSAITVGYANAQGYASYANNASNDFRYVNGTVVFAAGQTVQTVQVPITDDTATEKLEDFWFQLSVPAASQNLVTLARAEIPVFIVDNDSIAGGAPVVSVRDVVVDEATAGHARFVVSLDRPATATTTVQYQTVSGSAQAGADFLGASGTLTFTAGDTVQVVEAALLDDALPENAEEFRLLLHSPAGLSLGVEAATARIGASDQLAPKPFVQVDDLAVSEADGYAELVVRLDKASASAITVNYALAQGTASYANNASNDFEYLAGALVFAPGQTEHTLRVPLMDDLGPENPETFFLNLSLPAASQALATLSRAQATVSVVDDDSGFAVLSRGIGDDVYDVLAATDRVVENPGGGVDTIRTGLNGFVLPDNVENLVLLGTSNLNGTGNALSNVLAGNAGNNRLDGGAGLDTVDYLNAGAGVSVNLAAGTAAGGGGNDVLVSIEGAYGSAFADTITGTAAANVLGGRGGNDTLDGGAGMDLAVWFGARAGFTIAKTGATTATVADLVGDQGQDQLSNVERLAFTDVNVALDIDPIGAIDPADPNKGEGGIAGKAYRLYQAAFARTPDLEGVGYWISQMDAGAQLFDVATGFLGSAEFQAAYGVNPSNETYVRALYQNVLGRDPDQAGYDYWNSVLDPGYTTRQQMLIDFAESGENKALVVGVIGNGFDYVPWAA